VVTINCEYGTSKSLTPELIQLTLLDYFTGDTLIDKLVWPSVPMKDMNAARTGVHIEQMRSARAATNCFFGRDAAREEVWKFVGPDTIVVGHGLDSHLKLLRWIHTDIVDSFIIESTLQKEQADKINKEKQESRKGQKKKEDNKKEKPRTPETEVPAEDDKDQTRYVKLCQLYKDTFPNSKTPYFQMEEY